MMEQIVVENSPTISLKSLEKNVFLQMESDNFSKSGKIIKQ
jgi:hypothetical protein